MRNLSNFVISICLLASSAYSVAAEIPCQAVRIPNAAAGITLAGTLTTPTLPKAACVLATGSGPQDRDESILGHKPFKVLADTLAMHGYAILRMDDRGVGDSGGVFEGSTLDDFVSDIAAGVAYVDSVYKDLPVCVIGHSEGGSIAIRLAATDSRVDMIATLAAPAWRGDSVIMSQSRELATRALGRWDKEGLQRQLLDIAMSDVSDASARMSLQYVLLSQPEASIPQVRDGFIQSAKVMSGPYYRRMLRYDPAEDMRRVKVSWLAINGDRDVQVLCANLQTISECAPHADTVVMDGHNHLFQHCTTGMPDEYASLPEDISAETLAVIVKWLDRQVAYCRSSR